jgi:hypothetical protein
VTEYWRKPRNEEIHDLYASPSIRINQIKDLELGEAYSTHGKMRNAYKIMVVNLKGRNHLEYLRVDGRIILKRTL